MNLRIAQVGIGAIGSIMAKALLKLSPQRMVLVDSATLEPGNFVRHESLSTAVDQPKAAAMEDFAKPLTEGREFRSFTDDILRPSVQLVEELGNSDLVIDTTGAPGVHAYLAKYPLIRNTKIAWAYITPGPDFGFLILRRPESTLDVDKAELRIQEHLNSDTWSQIEDADSAADNLVWPEPGCYHPTFQAPYHRLATMVSSFVSTLVAWLDQDTSDLITVFQLADRDDVLGTECHILLQLRL